MRKIFFMIMSALAATAALTACVDDDSNSVLNDFENEFGTNTKIELEYDTVRGGGSQSNPLLYASAITVGQRLQMPMTVKYAYPERLKYTWMVVPYKNGKVQQVQVGNKLVYVQADTIANTRDLDYVVDLAPDRYRFILVAEDPVTGLSASYHAPNSNQGVEVPQEGVQGGLYLLTETTDGNTDIEVFTSDLMLIYGGLAEYKKYYSTLTGHTLEGKPRFIRGCSDGSTAKSAYMVATDKNIYRLNMAGLVTMDDWNSMFYETPATYNPQAMVMTNSCEFLINDGRLHTLYLDKANSRKYSAAVAGDSRDYEAMPWLMSTTKTTWRPTPNAIDADQVVFDAKNLRFVPYFARKTSMSTFLSTSGDAVVDANKLPAKPMAIVNGVNNTTYAIVKTDGATMLYRYNFYNRVDEGDLSADGARSALDISACTDINNATMFATCTVGPAFYYSSGKNVYSFSPQTGQTASQTVYTCEPGEEVTCIYAWGSMGGGFPTSSVIMWIATWNAGKQEGKLIQYEMDHNTGLPNSMWGPMFGAPDNPVITTGWGKIKAMTNIDAE